MDIGTVICITVICIAVVVASVAIATDRAGKREIEARGMRIREEADRERRRIDAEVRKGELASNFYVQKTLLETLQMQSKYHGEAQAATIAAATRIAERMGENDQLAIEALENRAVVDAYTRMLLQQKEAARLGVAGGYGEQMDFRWATPDWYV